MRSTQSARFHDDLGSLINIGAALTHRRGPDLAGSRMQNSKTQWDDVWVMQVATKGKYEQQRECWRNSD